MRFTLRAPSLYLHAVVALVAFAFAVSDLRQAWVGIVVVAALLWVPGRAVDLGATFESPVDWVIVAATSIAIEVVLALLMVWTSFWHPQAVGAGVLLVSGIALLIRAGLANRVAKSDQQPEDVAA